MKCPVCNMQDSRVLESREVEEGGSMRRRRECIACKNRFTTYERVEMPNLMVVKKNGDRELFDREKLSRGIYRAFEKRPVPADEIERVISEIERRARALDLGEIQSRKLGQLVMEGLIATDDVAYVRFASVYRRFSDIAGFEKELTKIRTSQKRDTKK